MRLKLRYVSCTDNLKVGKSLCCSCYKVIRDHSLDTDIGQVHRVPPGKNSLTRGDATRVTHWPLENITSNSSLL